MAQAMGVSEGYFQQLSKRLGNSPAFDEVDARLRAQANLADVAALSSLDEDDIAVLAQDSEPLAALADEVEKRSDRHLIAVLGAHASWAKTEDPTERTRPAREAFDARFEREVDPGGRLPEAERKRRAASARKAHFARMALKSAQARRAKK
jgi:hypothetical protein